MPSMQVTPHPVPVNRSTACAPVSRITDCAPVSWITDCAPVSWITDCDLESRSNAPAPVSVPGESFSTDVTLHRMSNASEEKPVKSIPLTFFFFALWLVNGDGVGGGEIDSAGMLTPIHLMSYSS